MIEEHLLEIAKSHLDEDANVSISLLGSQWIFNLQIISIKYDCLRYTYYEFTPDRKSKRLVERITPLEMIEEIKITMRSGKTIQDLEKDLSLHCTEPILPLENETIIELDPEINEEK
jgi:hypothetical protein